MNQKITNIAATSIAICALGLSIWQGYIQRSHNHVSLEPRLNAYFKIDGRTNQWGLYVFNNGMGPAYLEKIEVLVNGEIVKEGEFGQFGSALLPLGLDPECLTVGGPRPNDSFKTGEEIAMIETSLNISKKCSATALKLRETSKSNLNFTLTIKSIYGDRFEYNYKENIQRAL